MLLVKAQVETQVGVETVAAIALREHLATPGEVVELFSGPIHLGVNVISEIPTLEEPRGDEVGLQLGEGADDQLHLVPAVLLLELGRLVPQVGDRHAARSRQGQLDGAARYLDIADILLAQAVLFGVGVHDRVAPEPCDREQDPHADQVCNLPIHATAPIGSGCPIRVSLCRRATRPLVMSVRPPRARAGRGNPAAAKGVGRPRSARRWPPNPRRRC